MFYSFIQDANCNGAWDLIHSARKRILLRDFSFGHDHDVEDDLPRNNICDLELKDFADVVRSEKWDDKYLLASILENIRLYYEVPEEHVALLNEMISKLQFWYISDPEMITAPIGKLKFTAATANEPTEVLIAVHLAIVAGTVYSLFLSTLATAMNHAVALRSPKCPARQYRMPAICLIPAGDLECHV
jgi:hypothetical protein